jgi:hypothetical protein
MVKKIKVAPIREIFHHWLDIIKNSTAITCTSLVTRIVASVSVLDEGDVNYIEIPRIIKGIIWKPMQLGGFYILLWLYKRDSVT